MLDKTTGPPHVVALVFSLSFDRPGFLVHQKRFDPGDLDVDMTGKRCLVTGASSGLGLATSRALAGLGAEVWMLCRDPGRGARARDEVATTSGNPEIHLALADLARLGDIAGFCDSFEVPELDVLVCNAGVMPRERTITEDGLELTLATNLVGHFALTWKLLPRLRAAGGESNRPNRPGGLPGTPGDLSAGGRVITISSGGMYTQRLDIETLQGQRGRFNGMTAYAQTKRAQVIANELWAERVAELQVSSGRTVQPSFYCMHPGWADTKGVRASMPRFHRFMARRLRSADQGADTIVWLCACKDIPGPSGGFFFDRRVARTHMVPWTRESRQQRDDLWQCLRRWSSLDRDLDERETMA